MSNIAKYLRPGYDVFWRFAAERQEIYYKRLANEFICVTSDPILLKHRFTNPYRASDRVSQYLITNIQYDRHRDWEDVFARTMLFKFFNKISTWENLTDAVGDITVSTVFDPATLGVLDELSSDGPIYSAAYLIPPPPGKGPKTHRHVALLQRMLTDNLPEKIQEAPSLESVFACISSYESIGSFLAYQYTIDLNYTSYLDLCENDFVVAGPGSRRGLAKTFSVCGEKSDDYLFKWMAEKQHTEFERRALNWNGLWGRDLHLIDIQNLFCEVDKYTRLSNPELSEYAPGERIKQIYKPNPEPMTAWFPPKWGITQKST